MKETPRKRDKEASKQALLRAGLEVFSKYGYDAGTTKMVATEAGLSEELITRYFGGKAGLLLAILAAFVDEEAHHPDYPPAADSAEEEISQFLLHRHARLLESQSLLRTLVPRVILDAAMRDKLEPILAREATVLHERLSGLQQRRLIRQDADLESATLMISGQSFQISFILRVSSNIGDAHLRHVLSEFASYMARGLAPLPL
jgi:AcrR family transcriptional regulator